MYRYKYCSRYIPYNFPFQPFEVDLHGVKTCTVCEVFAQFLETNQPHCMFKSLSAIFAVFTCTANFGGQFDIMISYHSHHILS